MKFQMPFVIVALTAMLAGARPLAQDLPPAEKPLVPLDIQIVVSRFQGEKKVTSLPFSVAVNANDPGPSQLRMNAHVPVPASVFAPGPPDAVNKPLTSWNYQDVGTAIDCNAKTLDDGRFQVFVSVEDSSVYTNVQDTTTPSVKEMPVLRSFKSKNTLLLRDGQTRQFTAATDRISGEVVKIDVTLKVVK